MVSLYQRPHQSTYIVVLATVVLSCEPSAKRGQDRWSQAQAKEWHDEQPWLVGCKFVPSTAINQLDMWNDFDHKTMDCELGWAADIGFNTIRVFLHDVCWQEGEQRFFGRIEQFLEVCDKHQIRPIVVIFDGVWEPDPRSGLGCQFRPGLHNSGWVLSPGRSTLSNEAKQNSLERYVCNLIERFGDDNRILAWGLFNEPDNPNTNSYGPLELPNKEVVAAGLVKKSFAWARKAGPSQPLTVGLWRGPAWNDEKELNDVHRLALELSDVITFHDYGDATSMKRRIHQLQVYGRPALCTEFIARGNGSTFETILPVPREERVDAYC